MSKLFLLATALVLGLGAGAAPAHEFWIDPERYRVSPQEEIRAHFRNGEKLKGVALAYFDRRSARFEQVFGSERTEVTPRSGDNPAFVWTAPGDGLLVIAHETTPSKITYKSWEKFTNFAEHKDFPDIRSRHLSRGLPETGFTETYTRHVKALIGVGEAQGQDLAFGMETEFVALANPYTDDVSAGLPILLLYNGAPRPDAQVEVFARRPDGTVETSLARTDNSGRAIISVVPGTEYFLDAVVLRPAPDGDKAVWESLWAGLGFLVPER